MIKMNPLKAYKNSQQSLQECQSGITIIEMLISISLFVLTIVAVADIFTTVLSGQKNAIVARNIQENIRYAFDSMAKELRMARIEGVGSDDLCDGWRLPESTDPDQTTIDIDVSDYRIYDNDDTENGDGKSVLKFRNYRNECVVYDLHDERLRIYRDGKRGYITPDEIKVSNLNFRVRENYGGSRFGGVGAGERKQAVVNIRMDIEALGSRSTKPQTMFIQTSISSRHY